MTKNFFQRSILFSVWLGVFAFLSSIGGFILGLAFHHGTYITLSCLTAAIAMASYLWWSSLHHVKQAHDISLTLVLMFSIVGGLALYTNLTWGLWAIGVPLDLGTVRNGKMAEHYWLGPSILLYAIGCYIMLKREMRKHNK